MLTFRRMPTPLGEVTVVADDDWLTELHLPGDDGVVPDGAVDGGPSVDRAGQQLGECSVGFHVGLGEQLAIHLARKVESPSLERHETNQPQRLDVFTIEFEQAIGSLRGGRQVAAGARHLECALDGSRIAVGETGGEITLDGALAVSGEQGALRLAAIGGLQSRKDRREQQQ